MKIHSEWIISLSVSTKTIQLLEENRSLYGLKLGNGFLHVTPKTKKPKKKQTNFTSKFTTYVHQNNTKKVKRHPTEREKIFPNHILGKRLYILNPEYTTNS